MAQQKATGKQPDKPTKTESSPKTPPPAAPYTVKPEFWDAIFDSLPPWGDEIAAIVLIVFGIVSLLSLFNLASDATIATAWSNALTRLFGYGSVVVSIGILGLGVVILLPKMNIVVKFPARRILALEIAFLALLALLHLYSNDPELRALARAGQGGGYIGWALSYLISGLLGSTTAIVFYGLLLLVSFGVVLGMRRLHIQKWLGLGIVRLQTFAEKMAQPPKPRRERKPATIPAMPADPLELPTPPTRRATSSMIVRVRIDPANIPPSLRPGA
ncbi:MAG TPA: DNA translocase FtsK 4TM domain-containing protein, partial [Phototrophicaceae bacterium]|nr:DNA translocase FtsK 4TM domain-containing protein [Phototrophicaceae bacterium]